MEKSCFCGLVVALLAAVLAGGGIKARAGSDGAISQKQIVLYLHVENDHVRLSKVQFRNAPYLPPRGGYSGTWKIELLGNGKDERHAKCNDEHHARGKDEHHEKDKHELLYEKRFMDPNLMFWDEFDPVTGKIIGGGSQYLTVFDFSIVLPDLDGARRIKVYRQKIINTPEPKSIDWLLNTVQLPPRNKWEVLP